MIAFFARLHPLLVHLPIGALFLAFALECVLRWRGKEQLREAIRISLMLGIASIVLSAGSGWLLSEEGGYEAEYLSWHKWSGFGTLGVFALVWFGQQRPWYFPVFAAGVLGLCITGHFGGVLTHGADYLWEGPVAVAPLDEPGVSEVSLETPVFAGLIQPILDKKCVNCHGASKQKGGLRLDTEAFIKEGGKHGTVLVAGKLDSSSLWQRVQLPLQHDDHMPPAGKTPLTNTEMQLIKWWVEAGAPFQGNLNEHPLPKNLQAALSSGKANWDSPVFSQKVAMASATALQQLEALHINVKLVGEGKPWLSASLAGQEQLGKPVWDALGAISEQLVDLDLSHTGVNDQSFSGKRFPNLIRLNLAHTSIGNKSLTTIGKAKYLESLNLTNTLIDNALQDVLPQLPRLKRLYLWQCKTSKEAMAGWSKQYPGLAIEFGADAPADAPLRLLKPKLLCGRTFFDDTMHVGLELKFSGVDIYYTLDEAASPTSQSAKFKETIVIDKTSHLKAYAAKPGWDNSPLIEASFVKKKYVPVKATFKKPQSPKYPDAFKGPSTLIDGKISDYRETDTWNGFEGEHMEATLDLGAEKTVEHVFVHCLEHNVAWIFLPKAIHVFTSMDGKKYEEQSTIRLPQNSAMGEHKAHLLSCKFAKSTQARYVRVFAESWLKNPSWHVGKGKDCWIFVDEIVVE